MAHQQSKTQVPRPREPERKPTYYELLRHPKWQRKRLEILELFGFSCSQCGATDQTLNVHHAYYEKGLRPWEYPNQSLHALCDTCHQVVQDRMTRMQRQIGRIDLPGQEVLLGCALALEAQEFPMVPIDVTSYEIAEGIGSVWHLPAQVVIDNLLEGVIDGYRLQDLEKAQAK